MRGTWHRPLTASQSSILLLCVSISCCYTTTAPTHVELHTLTASTFESNVLVHPRPWVVVFSDTDNGTFVQSVLRHGVIFGGLVDFGFVNISNDPRLAKRFWNTVSKNGQRHVAAHKVVGFRADARGLGSHNRVSFDPWRRLPANSSSSVTLFKRLTSRLLDNFVEVLSDGEVAENFFRPHLSLGLRDDYVADLSGGNNAPFILYFSARELRRPPPEYIDSTDSSSNDEGSDELTPSEVLANVPPELALLSLRFVGRLKFGFVPKSEAAIISTFQVTEFPALLACVLEPVAGSKSDTSSSARFDDDHGDDDQDVGGTMTVSPHHGAMTYEAVRGFLDGIVSTSAGVTSVDSTGSFHPSDVAVQRAADLRRQCRDTGDGVAACLVIASSEYDVETHRARDTSSATGDENDEAGVDTRPGGLRRALRELEVFARELRPSVRVLWTPWPAPYNRTTSRRPRVGVNDNLLLAMARSLWKQEREKQQHLEQQHRRGQRQRQQSSKDRAGNGNGTRRAQGGIDPDDPFGTRHTTGERAQHLNSTTAARPPIAVFLLNVRRGRFTGFGATRFAELSPLRLRQFVYENARGLLQSFEVAEALRAEEAEQRHRQQSR